MDAAPSYAAIAWLQTVLGYLLLMPKSGVSTACVLANDVAARAGRAAAARAGRTLVIMLAQALGIPLAAEGAAGTSAGCSEPPAEHDENNNDQAGGAATPTHHKRPRASGDIADKSPADAAELAPAAAAPAPAPIAVGAVNPGFPVGHNQNAAGVNTAGANAAGANAGVEHLDPAALLLSLQAAIHHLEGNK